VGSDTKMMLGSIPYRYIGICRTYINDNAIDRVVIIGGDDGVFDGVFVHRLQCILDIAGDEVVVRCWIYKRKEVHIIPKL
jgi:hypothetical protein